MASSMGIDRRGVSQATLAKPTCNRLISGLRTTFLASLTKSVPFVALSAFKKTISSARVGPQVSLQNANLVTSTVSLVEENKVKDASKKNVPNPSIVACAFDVCTPLVQELVANHVLNKIVLETMLAGPAEPAAALFLPESENVLQPSVVFPLSLVPHVVF